MEPIEIIIHMKRARVSQSAIARKINVTPGFVNQVVWNVRRTGYVRRAIAKAVGKRVQELWPSYAKASEGSPSHNRKAA